MAEFTMAELLTKHGYDVKMAKDGQFTKVLAAELRKKGYRQIYKKVDGKVLRVWSNEQAERQERRVEIAIEITADL